MIKKIITKIKNRIWFSIYYGIYQKCRLKENMVFIELLRRGYDPEKSIFYYRTSNDKEVDFVTRDGRKVTSLIQVSYDISKAKTRKREFEALVKASDELRCDDLTLITWDLDDSVEYNGKRIRIASVCSWFLSPCLLR